MTLPAIMERASKLIRGLGLPSDAISAEELACVAWAEAVGKKIAAHTRAVRLVRTRLVVEVEDKIWQRQLMTLTPFILFNLQKHLDSGMVDDLELRVVPRRREPQRALAAFRAGTERDEADSIADPVLRSIYKASRKKALA
jgi:Dna[CI] antecedent, DciA